MSGYVYFIKPKYKDGPYKIGCTKNLRLRLAEIQTSHYEDLEVLLVIEAQDYKALEKAIHKRFKRFRIRGEWFCGAREIYEAMTQLPGVYTPLEFRDVSTLPNRSWHATKVPTEIDRELSMVKWSRVLKWDEAPRSKH